MKALLLFVILLACDTSRDARLQQAVAQFEATHRPFIDDRINLP